MGNHGNEGGTLKLVKIQPANALDPLSIVIVETNRTEESYEGPTIILLPPICAHTNSTAHERTAQKMTTNLLFENEVVVGPNDNKARVRWLGKE